MSVTLVARSTFGQKRGVSWNFGGWVGGVFVLLLRRLDVNIVFDQQDGTMEVYTPRLQEKPWGGQFAAQMSSRVCAKGETRTGEE